MNREEPMKDVCGGGGQRQQARTRRSSRRQNCEHMHGAKGDKDSGVHGLTNAF